MHPLFCPLSTWDASAAPQKQTLASCGAAGVMALEHLPN